MKKSFLLLALLTGVTSLVQAQSAIPAGTVSLGGNIGYSRRTENNATSSSFQIMPRVGYFVADNFALGLSLGYDASWTTFKNYPDGELDAATNTRLGAYGQYYKMFTDQFGVLGTLGAGYKRSFTPTYISSSETVDITRNGFYAGLTPGIIFFPIPKLGISAAVGGLGYERVSVKGSDTPATNSFDANFGLDQLTFGGTFYFGR